MLTDTEFIDFLLDLLNIKIHGYYIHNDAWLLLTREMDSRGYNPEEYFKEVILETQD